MSITATAWTDKHGDRWWPSPSQVDKGHYRWGRLRDGAILEVTTSYVELGWSLDRFVRRDTVDGLAWIKAEFIDLPPIPRGES